ncbi:hypothetical protein KKD42_02330 [Patescibacteria group bacterium]|nr:hypothetical protein [Patescibacteria group bacterium]
MNKRWHNLFPLAAAVIALSLPLFVLPALGGRHFLSPDETAVSIFGQRFADTGSFQISQPLAEVFSWTHPRSFVAQNGVLLPVGFLGMPLLAAGLIKLFGIYALGLFTPLLVISAVFPLMSFVKKWGRLPQLAIAASWLSFPTVILYANRGLFPNLAVVCLTLWSAWLIWRNKSEFSLAAAGILAGTALLIRPIEIVWIAPWLFLAFIQSKRQDKPLRGNLRQAAIFLLPLLLVCMLGAGLAWKTYGSPFVSGYQLKDVASSYGALAADSGTGQAAQSFDWPFGFHPHNVLFNVSFYLMYYLLPWSLVAFVALIATWKIKEWRRHIYTAFWTAGVLILIYGQALYQDHVRMNNVSLANSFLRYLLPLSVIAAFALAFVSRRLKEKLHAPGTALAAPCIALMVLFGLWTAFARDDEGLLQDRIELANYAAISSNAKEILQDGTVVLSDRSDKIFTADFLAVSPLPSLDKIKELAESYEGEVAVFTRTLDDARGQQWSEAGLVVTPLFNAGNETLYSVK